MAGYSMLGAVAVALLLAAPVADASHFRYGTMSWKATKDQPEDQENFLRVEIQLDIALRRGWLVDRSLDVTEGASLVLANSELTFGDGDGVTEFDPFIVTVSRESDDIVLGQYKIIHTYARRSASYEIVYEDCCRLDPCEPGVFGSNDCIFNNGGGDWKLTSEVDTNAAGLQSPTSAFVPIVEIGNTGTQMIQFVALPPDRDDLIWSLAAAERMGGSQPSSDPAIFSIDSATGILSWTVDGYAEGLYTAQVRVSGTKTPNVAAPVDFFIKVTADTFLCVDQCSVSGVVCSHPESDVPPELTVECSGACIASGAEYDSCQRNAPPEVDIPDTITQYVDSDVVLEVKFSNENIYETYQSLQLENGALPIGSTFDWVGTGSQSEVGTLTIPASMNADPVKYAACFVAHDGFISGPVKCTKIDVVRHEPPAVIAPEEVTGYNDFPLMFDVEFGEYAGNPDELAWEMSVTEGEAPECFIGLSSLGDSGMHGQTLTVTFETECIAGGEYEFTMCFNSDDLYGGVHTYGPQSCTKVKMTTRPLIECFKVYKSIGACALDQRCYWDKDGKDESHEDGPMGCYPFVECSQMDDTGYACTTHKSCQYTGFGSCIYAPRTTQEITEENPFGDPCRSFDKKTCREVDSNKLPRVDGKKGHCAWDTLNRWCVTPELHVTHADLCRPIESFKTCNNAIRNGNRCVWVEDPYHRDMRSPRRDKHSQELKQTDCPHNVCDQDEVGICMSANGKHGLVDGVDTTALAAELPAIKERFKTELTTVGAAAYTGEVNTQDPIEHYKTGKSSGWRWTVPDEKSGLIQ